MAKSVNFTVKLNIDGRQSLVTASADAENLAKNLASAKGGADSLRGALVSFGQLQLSFQNLQNGLQSITGVLNSLTEESRSFGAAMKAANTMAGKDAAGFGFKRSFILSNQNMMAHLAAKKTEYPEAHVVLWASLECTNFSRAKGGKPRDADSRSLAEHLFRYIEALKPDYIQIENVEEFMCWGDLDENGHPISRFEGRSYLRWVKNVCSYGYNYDWRLLNAADFGAYTSRKRFFGLFARKGLPICFPEQTYAKYGDEGGMFRQFKRWRPVRDVLDLADEGESIFTKKKPLCEKTLEL